MTVRKADDRVLHRGISRDYRAPAGTQWCITYEYRDGPMVVARFKTLREAVLHLRQLRARGWES